MDKSETISDSECKVMEAKLTKCMKNDIPFLHDEKFDFDLSFSPASETEDEVFIGPMGHKEKCISSSLQACERSNDENLPAADELTWSPLGGDKFVEVFKEAHIIALQLQSGSKTKRSNPGQLEHHKAEVVEKFVQESKSKLKVLEKGIMVEKTPKEVKRETYCVGQSPVCDLPASFLKHGRQPIAAKHNFSSPQRTLSAPSPGRASKLPQTSIMTLAQEKHNKSKTAGTIHAARNPSVPGNSNYLSMEQSKQGKLFSASSRNSLNSTGSSEDLLSDKSSIASEAGDLPPSNSSSLQEKRTLSTPSKLRMTAQLKPPSKIYMRKNTSTSSSSQSSTNSSLNTSLPISPKNGRARTTVPSNNFRPASCTSKVSLVKQIRRLSVQTPHSDASGIWQRSTNVTKENPSVNKLQNRGTLGSEPLVSGILTESSDPILQKLPRKNLSGSVRTMPSPQSQTKAGPPVSKKGVRSENVAAKVLQPLNLSPCGKIVSNAAVTPPPKYAEDGLKLNSCLPVKSVLRTPASTKFSALPAPSSQRISGIPALTPKSVPRSMTSSRLVPSRHASSVTSKKTAIASSKCARNSKSWMTASSSSTEDLSPPHVVPTVLDFSPEKLSLEMEGSKQPTGETHVKESLLIDIGIDEAPVALKECENKPLIDLNTPEMVKAPLLEPMGQLMDFPLISLSPEGNKENLDSPLLKF